MATSRPTRSAPTKRKAPAKSRVTRPAARAATPSKTPVKKKATARRSAAKSAAKTAARPAAPDLAGPNSTSPRTTTVPARVSAGAGVQVLSEPVVSLHLLALENAHKLATLQLDAWRRCADAVLTGCRDLSDADDAESLAACLSRQPETARELAAAAADDFQAAALIGMNYVSSAGDLLGRALNRAD